MSPRRRAWRDGARAAIGGKAFAMNPYDHVPRTTTFPSTDPRARWWADGYWWARQNRPRPQSWHRIMRDKHRAMVEGTWSR